VGNIFGRFLLRIGPILTLFRRNPAQHRFYYVPSAHGRRWKRALLLSPILLSLFFIAAGPGGRAISKALMTRITEMFSDPLLLFAERSPGGRGPGALLSTKTGLKPHERVLSSVRDRPDVPPEAGSPVFSTPQALESPADTLPGQAGGPPTSGPPFSNTPFFYPGPPPEGAPPPGTPPGGTPPGGTPPQGPPDTPTTPPTGPPPDTIPIPEPATWLMLVAGIVAIGAAARRRRFN